MNRIAVVPDDSNGKETVQQAVRMPDVLAASLHSAGNRFAALWLAGCKCVRKS